MDDCIFCKIVSGEIPSHKVWEDEKHMAFLTIFPNTEGVTVVITKEHNPSYIFDNSDEVVAGITLATKKVAKILDATFEDVGRCGMVYEGFGIDHLHSKLFPMHGSKIKEWKPIESGNKMKVYFDKYPGFISSHDSERADDTTLSELAARIRDTAIKLDS
jgi:diadenosine tetraphosphate (Ap4A) HIT family hydrolase